MDLKTTLNIFQGFTHTGAIENVNSLNNKYAPKNQSYRYLTVQLLKTVFNNNSTSQNFVQKYINVTIIFSIIILFLRFSKA